MLTSEFDYHLPAERIAQHPVARGESRLLLLDAAGRERHRRVDELPGILRAGDLLVREAGGVYVDFDGSRRIYNQAETLIEAGMAAGPPHLVEQFSQRERQRGA